MANPVQEIIQLIFKILLAFQMFIESFRERLRSSQGSFVRFQSFATSFGYWQLHKKEEIKRTQNARTMVN